MAEGDSPLKRQRSISGSSDVDVERPNKKQALSASTSSSASGPSMSSINESDDDKPDIAADLLDQLEAELTCGCCAGVFYRPAVLQPCNHAFCAACIISWVRNGGNGCPTCRSQSESILQARILQGMIELLIRFRPEAERSLKERQEADAIWMPGQPLPVPPARPRYQSPPPLPLNLARPCPHCARHNGMGYVCPVPIPDPQHVPREQAWDLEARGVPEGHGFCSGCDELYALRAPTSMSCSFCRNKYCGYSVQATCILPRVTAPQMPRYLDTLAKLLTCDALYEAFSHNSIEVDLLIDYLHTRPGGLNGVLHSILDYVKSQPEGFGALNFLSLEGRVGDVSQHNGEDDDISEHESDSEFDEEDDIGWANNRERTPPPYFGPLEPRSVLVQRAMEAAEMARQAAEAAQANGEPAPPAPAAPLSPVAALPGQNEGTGTGEPMLEDWQRLSPPRDPSAEEEEEEEIELPLRRERTPQPYFGPLEPRSVLNQRALEAELAQRNAEPEPLPAQSQDAIEAMLDPSLSAERFTPPPPTTPSDISYDEGDRAVPREHTPAPYFGPLEPPSQWPQQDRPVDVSRAEPEPAISASTVDAAPVAVQASTQPVQVERHADSSSDMDVDDSFVPPAASDATQGAVPVNQPATNATEPPAPARAVYFTRICRDCAEHVFLWGIFDWWQRERQAVQNAVPPEVRAKRDCVHGRTCAMQRDNGHAREFNHICEAVPPPVVAAVNETVAEPVPAAAPPAVNQVPAMPPSDPAEQIVENMLLPAVPPSLPLPILHVPGDINMDDEAEVERQMGQYLNLEVTVSAAV